MAIPFRVQTEIRFDPLYKLGELEAASRQGLLSVGQWWTTGKMPQHFMRFAIGKYGYRPRSKRYEARKLRKFGHQDPLVWSGALRLRARLGRLVVVGASRQWLRLMFQGGLPERRLELFKRTSDENLTVSELYAGSMRRFAFAPTPARVEGAGSIGPSPGAVAPLD